MIVVDRRAPAVRALDALDDAPHSFWAGFLTPLGQLYAALAGLHRAVRGERALPAMPPSLAVGNLRVGGTGKTPVVEDLGTRLRDRGFGVAVLSRGYRAGGGGDEPAWLADRGLDVHLGSDRHRTHARAARGGADVVLLDDGFQARARATRRLVIVLERDLVRPPRPLPAGPAREGAAALLRADGILVRRPVGAAGALCGEHIGRPCVGFRLEPTGWIDPQGSASELRPFPLPGPVAAVSGLARPRSFEATLTALGVPVVGTWRARDHWAPRRDEVARLVEWARGLGARALVCPEKNRARLVAAEPALPVHALAAAVRWDTDDPLAALGILPGLVEAGEPTRHDDEGAAP